MEKEETAVSTIKLYGILHFIFIIMCFVVFWERPLGAIYVKEIAFLYWWCVIFPEIIIIGVVVLLWWIERNG